MKLRTLFLCVSMMLGASLSAQTLQDAIALQFNAPDSAIAIATLVMERKDCGDTLRSNALEVIGIAQMVKSDLQASFASHEKALVIRKRLGWYGGIGHSLNNMGLALSKMGDLAGAMEQFLEGLKIAEEHDNRNLMTRIYGNIGTLYEEQKDYDRALEFYRKSLYILDKGEPNQILGNTLHNIALVYSRQRQFDTALTFWTRTLRVRETLNDDRGRAFALGNLGALVYAVQANYALADSVFAISLDIYTQLDDRVGMAMVLGSLGSSAFDSGRIAEALDLCERSRVLAKETSTVEYEVSACKCLSGAFVAKGNHKEANRFLLHYVALTDSINSSESGRKAALMEQRYGHEKEQMRVALERERERAMAEEEIKRQHLLRNMSVALGMMGILLFFIQFNSYRKTQKANVVLGQKNVEISVQKELIAEKSKAITDSIEYAKRLQEARLPRPDAFDRCFRKWHVFYRPKDIVSGDFYWLEEVDGRIFMAVADCTGHGVPGAMVSMVGIQGLNRAVLEMRLSSPAAILQFLSDHVEEAFIKGGTSVRDGMDIALCVIDATRSSLTYSGANSRLWQVTASDAPDGAGIRATDNGMNLLEWKGDRRSIGGYFNEGGFTDLAVPLKSEDTFILSSDGYADQFGGPKHWKIGSPNFRRIALQAAVTDDLAALDRKFLAWKGTGYQIDDVSVVAFRV